MAATDQLQKKLKFRRSCFRNLLCVLFLRAVETGKHALFRRTPSRSCLVRSLNGWLCSLHYLFLLYSPFHPVSLVLFQVTVAFVECSARRVMVQQRIPSAKLLFFLTKRTSYRTSCRGMFSKTCPIYLQLRVCCTLGSFETPAMLPHVHVLEQTCLEQRQRLHLDTAGNAYY